MPRNTLKYLVGGTLLVLGAGLSACNQTDPTPKTEDRVLGALELNISSDMTAVNAKPLALLDETKLTFTPSSVNVVDSSAMRYINATFNVQNNTGAAIKNLTLYAYFKAADNVGGTALKSIFNFNGTALSDATAAQGVKPAHAMTNAATINTAQADFQAFKPAEVTALETEARTASVITASDRVLEYGYVARNSGARGIANNGSGTITLGLRVPKNADSTKEPYRFVMTFVVADVTQTRVTRSREETASQASSRATAITDRSNPAEVLLVGPDTETTSCANCTVTRQSNAKTSSVPKNLYEDPSSLAFTIERVKENLTTPWSINFAPDGSLYFTSRDSTKVTVSRLNVGTGVVTKYETSASNVRDEGEGGVLGMEFAPDFATSNKIFVCYSYYKGSTVSNANRRNRLSSFVISGNTLTSEDILFDNMLGWSNHNGCRVANGPDGKLYFTMGDAADYNADADGAGDPAGDGTGNGDFKAQVKDSLAGKIFRINYDKSIPSDNPFFATSSGAARAVWSYGHRNPQGLAFQPGTDALWSTEHGPNIRDELNVIEKSKNYGWPTCTGTVATCSNYTDYKPAVAQYEPDSSTTIAASDIAFFNANSFPEWRGSLLMVSLKTGRIYRLTLNGQSVASEQRLAENEYGRLRDVTVGPDGFIYFATDQSTNSTIYRIKPQ
jgi:aldose sugar dehydrogenase